ncbi:hypothetical protein Tco_0940763 [Tanacetum coccineum]|uniref:Uncharacterized protein n=1 Tax=Tanacetum coccineum TaxID=301880 RepID=A0ABQ5DPT2_9ASTR
MTSSNKPTSKPSRVAKMSVKPILRKKLNPCNTSNELNVNSSTPMPKPLTSHHEPSQENNHLNQELPNPYIKDTPTSPQISSHPPFPISPINSHVTHTQSPPQSDNQTQHTPPLSPSRESLVDDITSEEHKDDIQPSKKPKITIIPPKQLFIDLTNEDTINPSPKLHESSPSAPNAPSKTPSTKDTSSSSIDYTPKSPTLSSSPSTNGYLNPPLSPPPRVPPPPPT